MENEQAAARAFSQQALVFDAYDAGNTTIAYKRKRVRDHVLRYLSPGSSILELNAGTGEDAIYFARQGHHVHATDIASGMQEALGEKVARVGLTDRISRELCSFTALSSLQQRGPYDLIFSNFAGLNCTGELDKVLHSFAPLVKPGGQVSLVILPLMKFTLRRDQFLPPAERPHSLRVEVLKTLVYEISGVATFETSKQ